MNCEEAWNLLKSGQLNGLKTKTGKDFEYKVKKDSILYIPKGGKGKPKPQSKGRFENFYSIFFTEKRRTPDDNRNKDGTGSRAAGYPYFMPIFRQIETYNGNIPICSDLADPPPRIKMEIYRIVRDTGQARDIKKHHDDLCQLCGMTIPLTDERKYSEAHHIKPLGGVHAGPDVPGNIIVVCPNHHAMLDLGVISLNLNEIRCKEGHVLASEFIEYHNSKIYGVNR